MDPSCSGSGVVRSLERAIEIETPHSTHSPTHTTDEDGGLKSPKSKSKWGKKAERAVGNNNEKGKTNSKHQLDNGKEGQDQNQNEDENENEEEVAGHGPKGGAHSTERLAELSAFQQKMVRKALSFPQAAVVVYSTCSIHEVR